MNSIKVAVGITLYHAEIKEIEYIKKISNKFSKIYVYDNSNIKIKELENQEDVIYFFNGKNDGLSVAFNRFLQESYKNSMDYLLILDQDSLYDDAEILKLKDELCEKPYDRNVGIYACKAQPSNIDIECILVPSAHTSEEQMVISSGSFINLKAIKENNISYDENLFVDYVDTDFCKQVHDNNLKIICYNKYVLKQSLGYLYNGYICHSAIRHYYMVRDLGYMNIKYYSRVATVLKSVKFYIQNLFTIMHEDNKVEKIKYSSRGLIDYLKNVKGEYVV